MTTNRANTTRGLRPFVRLFGRRWSTFQICGVTGLVLGTSLAMMLAGHASLSRPMVAGLLAVGIATLLVVTMATKIITGSEALVYYHHEIAVLTAATLLLSALHQPVLPYLDVTVVGLGVFLTCGRIGCLLVGCCHGKPYRWGVQYGHDHAIAGFPDRFVGARLFPVQALEGMVVASIVAGIATAMFRGSPPGTALSWYVATYSLARIYLEELRGDRARPYWLRLSEAQWTSLALIAAVVIGEWQGRLPWSAWHTVMCVTAALIMTVLAMYRGGRAIVYPRHVSEIAAIVRSPRVLADGVAVQWTSQMVGVSSQVLDVPGHPAGTLYSMSRADPRLTLHEARILARLIVNLVAPRRSPPLLIHGSHDVFHMIVRPGGMR